MKANGIPYIQWRPFRLSFISFPWGQTKVGTNNDVTMCCSAFRPTKGNSFPYTVDGSETPNNHLGWCWNLVNIGISATNLNWWVFRISEPSTPMSSINFDAFLYSWFSCFFWFEHRGDPQISGGPKDPHNWRILKKKCFFSSIPIGSGRDPTYIEARFFVGCNPYISFNELFDSLQNHLNTPIPSGYGKYLPTFGWFLGYINVSTSKYTSPMDAMGKVSGLHVGVRTEFLWYMIPTSLKELDVSSGRSILPQQNQGSFNGRYLQGGPLMIVFLMELRGPYKWLKISWVIVCFFHPL